MLQLLSIDELLVFFTIANVICFPVDVSITVCGFYDYLCFVNVVVEILHFARLRNLSKVVNSGSLFGSTVVNNGSLLGQRW